MLTARENMERVVFGGGEPERYVNQYEAIKLLFNPFMFRNPMAQKGGPEVVNLWGVTNYFPSNVPGAFPVHTPEKILVKDIEHWRDYVKIPSLKFADEEWGPHYGMYGAVDRTKAYTATFIAPGLFEQTHHFCSIDQALMYYITNEDEMHDMIKMLTDWELELAEGICSHLHPDAIFHHDDWGGEKNSFLRPSMFDDFFLDAYKQIYGYYHDHGVKMIIHHSDSYAANLVPEMIEMGINVWQGPMHTNNVPELVKKYGDKITFMGDIDNKFVDFDGWTPEDCFKAAYASIESVGTPKGFIPCITQGGPGSVYPGTYMELTKAIDQYNIEHFGCTKEGLEEARLPIDIMF